MLGGCPGPHARSRRSYHSQIHFALSVINIIAYLFTANARHSMQECWLFPIQLPSNTFAQHAFNARTVFSFFGGVDESHCFPIDAGKI